MNASFELVHRLKSVGHQVSYAAPRSIAKNVQFQGIEFIQLPKITNYKDKQLPNHNGALGKIKKSDL